MPIKKIVMKLDHVNLDLVFETSWEVCNKVGGIYTVLSTKAQTLQNLYKDKVIFIGPDVWSETTPSPYFTEVPSLLRQWKDKAELPFGISVRVGRWNIPGKPVVVLVKFDGMFQAKDTYYGEMWERFGVDSLHGYGDYDEACCFALASGIVIESICNHKRLRHKNVLAHFDEWTTGMGLLYTRWKLPYVGTIFHNPRHLDRAQHMRQRQTSLRLPAGIQRRPDGSGAQHAVEAFPSRRPQHITPTASPP